MEGVKNGKFLFEVQSLPNYLVLKHFILIRSLGSYDYILGENMLDSRLILS